MCHIYEHFSMTINEWSSNKDEGKERSLVTSAQTSHVIYQPTANTVRQTTWVSAWLSLKILMAAVTCRSKAIKLESQENVYLATVQSEISCNLLFALAEPRKKIIKHNNSTNKPRV